MWMFFLNLVVVLPAEAAPKAPRATTEVVASWYGEAFRGRPTASGEPFNPGDLTAAHKTLPFGTRLRVTNVETGKSVVVRINDRGPHVAGRGLDLSEHAAKVIGIRSKGVGRVRIQQLPAKKK